MRRRREFPGVAGSLARPISVLGGALFTPQICPSLVCADGPCQAAAQLSRFQSCVSGADADADAGGNLG
jgi:hypothetical protein